MVADQKRFGGIDLFRGLAVLAVIILHVDEGVQMMPSTWIKITDFATFAVPFFLAVSFYLAVRKLYTSQKPYPLLSRLIRLLIPYGVWSTIYLLYKITKYIATGKSPQVLELFQDPLSLIFFGGAAFHLYFLPLLATGTLLIKLAESLIARKIALRGLMILSLTSLLVYEWVLASGNGLKRPGDIAFEALLSAVFPSGNSYALLRWFLVELCWALRCLPYVMIALLLAHPIVHQVWLSRVKLHPFLPSIFFVMLNMFGALVLPSAIHEIAVGYTALIAAIIISNSVSTSSVLNSIGQCSFGIYLIHLLFVEVYQSIIIKLYPNYVVSVNTVILGVAAIFILLLSWVATILLMKSKPLSRILFGL